MHFSDLSIAKLVREIPSFARTFAKNRWDIRLRHGHQAENLITQRAAAKQQSALCRFSVPLSRTGRLCRADAAQEPIHFVLQAFALQGDLARGRLDPGRSRAGFTCGLSDAVDID